MQIEMRQVCAAWIGLLLGVAPAVAQTPLKISVTSPAPLVLSSTGPTPVSVSVAPGTDTVVDDSVKLFYRVGASPFQEVMLASGGGHSYAGEIPPGTCDAITKWYVAAEGIVTGIVTEPPGGAGAPFEAAVGDTTTFVSFNFETAPGWTVSGSAVSGAWALGVPVGCNRGDPPTDYDGSGMCYLTQPSVVVSPPTCDTDIDSGVTRLLSPVFNIAPLTNPHVRYARWYSNSTGSGAFEDWMDIEISGDGGLNWALLEQIGPSTSSLHPEVNGGWYPRLFRIGDYSLSGTNFRVRFTAFDQGLASTVEAGIDAFAIVDLNCVPPACIRGDMNGDLAIDGRDVARFAEVVVAGGATAAEICGGDLESTPDGVVGISDVPAFVACLLAGGCN